jgi:hypothetical protein
VRFTFKKHPTQKLLKKSQILGGFEELGEERAAAASSVLSCAAASVAWGESGQGATARGTGGTPLSLPPSPVEVTPRKLKSTPSAPVLTRMDTSVDPGGIL